MTSGSAGGNPASDPGGGTQGRGEATPLRAVAETSRRVGRADGRNEKVRRLANLLAGVGPGEAPAAAAFLAGELPDGPIGVGHATLDDVLPVEAASEPSLTVPETRAALRAIGEVSGEGAAGRRRDRLGSLLTRATGEEQDFLVRLILGELRQGAGEGLVVEALAEATGADPSAVRRAVMLRGELGEVARVALAGGGERLRELDVRLFQPLRPMLARTADGVAGALDRLGRAAFEFKFDGARIQAHRRGGEVRVFTRRLNDVTESLPEVVDAVASLEVREAVVDGEAIALREDGTPRPFQETMGRFGRTSDVERARRELPLTLFLFDLLYRDGRSLLEASTAERWRALEETTPPELRVPRTVTGDPEEAARFLDRALEAGHEGLLAKDLEAPYSAGSRGHAWLKVKPELSADLAVLAAEWGHGRREGWLSNLHLGARLPEAGKREAGGPEPAGAPGAASGSDDSPYPPGWAMVGKTFKGLTDQMLEWQTDRFRELERGREGRTVYVRPEVVAEVAFDGLQASPTYDSGVALRFARVKRYRPDLGPEDADTLARLREVAG